MDKKETNDQHRSESEKVNTLNQLPPLHQAKEAIAQAREVALQAFDDGVQTPTEIVDALLAAVQSTDGLKPTVAESTALIASVTASQPDSQAQERAPLHLVAHVGCGSVDEAGQCLRCDAIRSILRKSSPSEPWWLPERGMIGALSRFVDEAGSQKVAAERLKVSPQYLCDLLKERRDISADVASALGYQRLVVFVQSDAASVTASPEQSERHEKKDGAGLIHQTIPDVAETEPSVALNADFVDVETKAVLGLTTRLDVVERLRSIQTNADAWTHMLASQQWAIVDAIETLEKLEDR